MTGRRIAATAAVALLLAWATALAFTVITWPAALHSWYRVSGANNEAGPVYGSWSGIMGATGAFGWMPAGALLYWHHTCHESPWCLRWGKHPDASGMFRYCRHHHPDLMGQPLTREFRHRLHHEAKARR